MTPGPIDTARKISDCVARGTRELRAIPSPSESYQKKVDAVNARINHVWESLAENPSPPDRLRLQNEIVGYGGELKSLELQHEASVEDEERSYEQQLRAGLEQLCDNLVTVLGAPMVKRSLQSLSISESHQPALVGQSSRHDRSPPTPQQTPQAGDNRTGSRKRQTSAPAVASVEGPICITRAAKKRTMETALNSPQLRKRRRDNRSAARRKASIDFAQVFQDGHAPTKHVIVQFPEGSNKWYIFRCEEHDLSFKENPIKGAAVHLGSERHGRISREYTVAVEHLGVQVLGCDETLAKKNNAVARKALVDESEPSVATRASRWPDVNLADELPPRQTRRTRGRTSKNPLHTQGLQETYDPDAVVDPTPGEIYLAFWEKFKEWSPVLLLPTKDLDDVGVPTTVEDLGLAENVPSCYNYNPRTKKFSWRDGYEDGGRLVSQREFPVIYFDGLPFPEKSAVGWVEVKNLWAFDAGDPSYSLIPNLGMVRKFLKERKRHQPTECESEESEAEGTSSFRNESLGESAPAIDSWISVNSSSSELAVSLPGTPTNDTVDNEQATPARSIQELDNRSSPRHETSANNPDRGQEPAPTSCDSPVIIENGISDDAPEIIKLTSDASHAESGKQFMNPSGQNHPEIMVSEWVRLASIARASLSQRLATPENETAGAASQCHVSPAHEIQRPRILPSISTAERLSDSSHLHNAGDKTREQGGNESWHPALLPTQHVSHISASVDFHSYGLPNDPMTNNNTLHQEDLRQWWPNSSPSTALHRFPEPNQWDKTPNGGHLLPPIRPRPPEVASSANLTLPGRNAASISSVENQTYHAILHPGIASSRESQIPSPSVPGGATVSADFTTASTYETVQPNNLTFRTPSSNAADEARALAALPKRIVDQLNKNSYPNQHAQGLAGFKNVRGFYVCPICRRIKEYVNLKNFTGHLESKH